MRRKILASCVFGASLAGLIVIACTPEIGTTSQDAASDVSPVESGVETGVDAVADVGVDVSVVDAGIDVGTGFVSIAAWDHACAVMGDGRVACWGNNNYAQCGTNNDAGVLYAPEYVKGINNAKQVSVTIRTSCAVLTDETVKCWGNLTGGLNAFQQLPDVDGGILGGVQKVDVGYGPPGSAVMVLKTKTGDALCVGYDEMGACSNGGTYNSKVPTSMLSAPATPFTNIKDVAAGESGLSCVVASDGSVHCSGNYPRGDGTTGTISLASVAKTNSSTVFTGATEVSVAYQHACAIVTGGGVNCWGANNLGQLGIPHVEDYPLYVPTAVTLTGKAVNVSSGMQHSCVSVDNGTMQCWGWGASGQLGNGAKANSFSAVTVAGLPGGTSVRYAAAANEYSCAAMKDGTAYCWGKGDTGQLGDGKAAQSDTPVQVSMPK